MSVDIHGLNIAVGGRLIVSDVDLAIADGERVGLIGSSGSGKSMISKAILGLLPLTAAADGSIDMSGTESSVPLSMCSPTCVAGMWALYFRIRLLH